MDPVKIAAQAISSQYGDRLRNQKVIAAVSGGCDSIVMLHILKQLQSGFGYELAAVTVDHNMRTDGTSQRDVLFTESFCHDLDVECIRVEIPQGKLAQTEKIRNGGLEDAARFLRYGIFASLAEEKHAAAVFLAHNRNDQLETILERFLQGSDSTGSKGILRYRHPYFRPLLSVSRAEIETYARDHQLSWCTDPTNSDTSYLRNRIRHNLMPLLDDQFPGWDTAVVKGSGKAALESEALNAFSQICTWSASSENSVQTDLSSFLSQPLAVRTRILYNGLQLLTAAGRIPYSVVAAFAETQEQITACGVIFSADTGNVLITRETDGINGAVPAIDGFCCMVMEPGEYQLPFGRVVVEQVQYSAFTARHVQSGATSGLFKLPAVFRNGTSLDVIRTKDNRTKGVMKILSEWKVPQSKKNQIPVIEDTEVRGIWGAPAGFDDWFVLQGVDL